MMRFPKIEEEIAMRFQFSKDAKNMFKVNDDFNFVSEDVKDVAIEIQNSFDEKLVEIIINDLKRQGFSDVILINRTLLISAIKKQTPKKCKNFRDVCECGHEVYPHMNFCSKCGQRLDWGNFDENL